MKKSLSSFLKACLAGVSIGIGGSVYLSCDNRYIGAFLFAIGLFLIFSYDLNLFTGKVGYALENPPAYILFLVNVWFGNLVGTGFVALLLKLTRLAPSLSEKAYNLCCVKSADSFVSVFILSFFCGVMMFLAADGYKKSDNVIRKYLSVFLPVMIFILSGFEHCIANMYYFFLADFFSVNTVILLLVMTLGNTVGSFLFPLVLGALVKLSHDNQSKK